MISVAPREGLFVLAVSVTLALTGCASTPTNPEGSEGSETSSAPSEPTAVTPGTACPEGFVDAFGVATADSFDPADYQYREATVDEFPQDFLVPFLDGGCAVYVTGSRLLGQADSMKEELVLGFSSDGSKIPEIRAAFEEAGFEEFDPAFPGGYSNPTTGEFGTVFEIGGPVSTFGQSVLDQFYPGGVIFS